ncbi:hypothetical protein VNO77_20005 [Canavalia gladiata]|uniref:Uncharacterized protein n=1 Tax=Canavalia gladiata TaxID=3824 RepID=A0AAN9LNR4_CANGL
MICRRPTKASRTCLWCLENNALIRVFLYMVICDELVKIIEGQLKDCRIYEVAIYSLANEFLALHEEITMIIDVLAHTLTFDRAFPHDFELFSHHIIPTGINALISLLMGDPAEATLGGREPRKKLLPTEQSYEKFLEVFNIEGIERFWPLPELCDWAAWPNYHCRGPITLILTWRIWLWRWPTVLLILNEIRKQPSSYAACYAVQHKPNIQLHMRPAMLVAQPTTHKQACELRESNPSPEVSNGRQRYERLECIQLFIKSSLGPQGLMNASILICYPHLRLMNASILIYYPYLDAISSKRYIGKILIGNENPKIAFCISLFTSSYYLHILKQFDNAFDNYIKLNSVFSLHNGGNSILTKADHYWNFTNEQRNVIHDIADYPC